MMSQHDSFADDLRSLGESTGDPITVRLSNEIVTLLSSQLYQSPLKAIEELVVNSFDADATECRLFLPDGSHSVESILVYDDGIGMDTKGLSDLWWVARSNKRTETYQRQLRRKQIGKFGIGKLATYAIASNITYISRTADQVLAVSVNYNIFRGDPHGSVPIELPVHMFQPITILRESEVFCNACDYAGVSVESLLDPADKTWTVVLLEELKPIPIHPGRLRWVLSTAMPLRPNFRLYLNQEQITSSKEDTEIVVEFDVTDLPEKRMESVTKKTKDEWHVENRKFVSSSFPRGIHGSVIVTKDSLHAGKSRDLGRSHGFFIKVRERLINEEDPLFGLSPRSYQTFNRFRADIAVDDLDTAITAPREGIGESPLKYKVLPLLGEVFQEARDRYNDHLKQQDDQNRRKRDEERTYVPVRLVEHPIADVLSLPPPDSMQGTEADESWFYLDIPTGTELQDLVRTLYTRERLNKYRYRYAELGQTARLVCFNPKQSTFYLNNNHDLVIAYYDDPRARVLLEDVATAEAVLEVYLREHGMSPHIVGDVLERRDSLLRGLANEHIFSLVTIGNLLKDSASDQYDLEVSLVAASRALGFVATHLGGSGEPDGIARFKDYPRGEQKITLEAKSSIHVPRLPQIDFSGLRQHVIQSGANGCLLVAPGYPGESLGDTSSASCRAREDGISCWTIDQLARVVEAVETRHIGARDVLDIVLTQYAPEDVKSAIDKLLSEPTWTHRSLYREILRALRRLEGRLTDRQRTVSHIAVEVTGNPDYGEVPQRDINDAIKDLAAASRGGLLLRGDNIKFNASFEEIERRLSPLTGDTSQPRRGGAFRDIT